MSKIQNGELPIPAFFDPSGVNDLRFVQYPGIVETARQWQKQHKLAAAVNDNPRICCVPIDVMGTFVMPGGGLVVEKADEATVLGVQWAYRNMHRITEWAPTLDTHTVWQIFHESFLIDANGNHPDGATPPITPADIQTGKWQLNPAAVYNVIGNKDPGNFTYLREFLQFYVNSLEAAKKYQLKTWPYHALLGGMEHALVPILHEAIFFHEIARSSQRRTQIKGGNPMVENYSPLQPEVTKDQNSNAIGQKNTQFIKRLLDFDYIVSWGFASSHCFAWFVNDLLNEIKAQDPNLVRKVYLLRDCTAPVIVRTPSGQIIPGLDFTPQADAAFDRFASEGMHVVNSTTPMEQWPGMKFA